MKQKMDIIFVPSTVIYEKLLLQKKYKNIKKHNLFIF